MVGADTFQQRPLRPSPSRDLLPNASRALRTHAERRLGTCERGGGGARGCVLDRYFPGTEQESNNMKAVAQSHKPSSNRPFTFHISLSVRESRPIATAGGQWGSGLEG